MKAQNNHPQAGQLYEHFKSTKQKRMLYQIIGVAHHTETEEKLVVYKTLYETNYLQNLSCDFACRPLKMFLENVEFEGKIIPRFSLVEN